MWSWQSMSPGSTVMPERVDDLVAASGARAARGDRLDAAVADDEADVAQRGGAGAVDEGACADDRRELLWTWGRARPKPLS